MKPDGTAERPVAMSAVGSPKPVFSSRSSSSFLPPCNLHAQLQGAAQWHLLLLTHLPTRLSTARFVPSLLFSAPLPFPLATLSVCSHLRLPILPLRCHSILFHIVFPISCIFQSLFQWHVLFLSLLKVPPFPSAAQETRGREKNYKGTALLGFKTTFSAGGFCFLVSLACKALGAGAPVMLCAGEDGQDR